MTATRQYNLLDRLIIGLERTGNPEFPVAARSQRQNPAQNVPETPLNAVERRLSAGLMRVNHAGEVAAQALYQGQGVAARDPVVQVSMETAAQEEIDHLVWCRERLRELGSRPSYLDPVWYLGSFTIGTLAGFAGDRWSLGFVAETEHQVVRHIESHLQRISPDDHRSRAILDQMKIDEAQHATTALESGAAELPRLIKQLMKVCSRVMTTTAYRV